jgi:nicotinate-nucleotide pyrophosphorylase (carboxylating)
MPVVQTDAPVRRITKELLGDVAGTHVAQVSATLPGIVAGMDLVSPGSVTDSAGHWTRLRADGDRVGAGEPLLEITGTAWEIAVAHDHALGVLGYAGGIASAAIELSDRAPAHLRIACGGWKKLPHAMKPVLRAALAVTPVTPRLVDGDFVYIDKVSAALSGGIAPAVRRGLALGHGVVAIQVVDAQQARDAADAGAGIVMVDTGSVADFIEIHEALARNVNRDGLRLAYGGGVTAEALVTLAALGVDIVDVGRAILDAPLWDLHLEVVG